MGLDQYAYTARKSKIKNPLNVNSDALVDKEFRYWRKNNQLQGWMQSLYVEKCKKAEVTPDPDFNCVPIELTKSDILRLKTEITHFGLQEASGFFWGNYPYDEECMLNDLDFCNKALEVLQDEDMAIVYDCWY